MGVGAKTLTYDHYKSTDWQKPIDSAIINFEKLLMSEPVNLRQ